jgi:iron complex outermembrane receptor protein
MRRLILLNLVFLYTGFNSPAQVRIFVKDAVSGKPLPGANAINHNNGNVYVATTDGRIENQDITKGNTLTISHVGYKTKSITVVEGDNMAMLEVDYLLMSDITVIGYEDNRKLSEIAAAYAIAPAATLRRFGDDSIVRPMNTLPGIRFEERSPISYRVSIRGSLLRAPYGVRNVKVYWNSITFTDPNGNSPLNALDMNNIGSVEVIKGPAGSVFGAGMGGVLNIKGESMPASPVSASVGYGLGSFGFQKLTANVNTSYNNHQFSMRFASQQANGYRDHTESDRKVFQAGGTFFTSAKRSISAQLLFSDMFYETPGGLTQQQYDENPRQARPGAETQNASIDNQYFLAGIVQDYSWNENLRNSTSLFYTNNVKENPFTNNYELEKLNSFGGRSVFDINTHIADMPTVVTTGVEWNLGNYEAGSHGNVNGYADTLRYQDELKSQMAFAFGQVSMNLSERWIATAGASVNYLNYDIHRLRDVALDTSYQITRTFNPEFVPRVGIVGKLSKALSVFASISSGFSPPTSEEVRTSDGGINADLEAERGISYETGFRGNSINGRFFYDVTGFWMQQSQTIVSKATEGGSVIFENAGATSQPGLETLLSYLVLHKPESFISILKIQTAYTWNGFTFDDYVKVSGGENIDFSGNELTGTARNVLVATIDVESKTGFYLNFTHNFTDKIPLDDGNTVYSDSYQLLSLRAGYSMDIHQSHGMEIYGGIDNLLDEKYSLGNDLNAFGGRYFNAAPTRNCFAGIRFHLNKY